MARLPLKVLYQDTSLIVFDKPPGLVVTTSETHQDLTLEEITKKEYGIQVERGGIVHRLDKDTSGLIMVAKTGEVLEALQDQFKERTIFKQYLALVHGFLETSGRIEASIIRNPRDREKFIAITADDKDVTNSREAVTEYEPVEMLQLTGDRIQELFSGFNKIQMRKLERSGYGKFTLLSCHPLTGRTHQIRVHLKYLGFPIVGDGKYGGRKTVRLDHRFCLRQFLHAAKLEFTHPQTGETIMLESKLPEDLEQTLSYLEKV